MRYITDLVSSYNTIFNFRANSKEEAISKLLQILIDNFQIHRSKKEIYLKKIIEREKTKTTGLGYGIAIPHCTTEHIDNAICVVGISSKGVNFESNDKALVYLFFLFIFPHSQLSSNLELLAHLTSVLNNEDYRKKILECKNFNQFHKYLKQATKIQTQ